MLNHEGEAIALNAGGKIGTAASFYLPLDRVKRALELIQQGGEVQRGTIQAVFQYKVRSNFVPRMSDAPCSNERTFLFLAV